MNKNGWLVNDTISCIPGVKTFWHNLLEWFPKLTDKTNGYTDYSILANVIENDLLNSKIVPYYIIRNGTYFRKINTPIKQVSLIQDIHINNHNQIDVINNSDVVVFNTTYVYNKYAGLINNSNIKIKICPLGVDFNFFKPIPERHLEVLPNSIIFIGDSSNYPKGFNIMLDIIRRMKSQNFVLIMKDNFLFNNLETMDVTNRVKIFNRVNTESVKLIINSCIAAVCTSYEETQHLSGIECGACNLPIIAREVGIYFDCKNDTRWGEIADDNTFVLKINYVLENINNYQPRKCFIEKYSTETCNNNWVSLIESL